jgi:hypothetical protein
MNFPFFSNLAVMGIPVGQDRDLHNHGFQAVLKDCLYFQDITANLWYNYITPALSWRKLSA